MDVKQAIAAAKEYLQYVYADEHPTGMELRELEHMPATGRWAITLSFSMPRASERTPTQAALEQLGAVYPLKRTAKVVTMESDGTVLSMKDKVWAEAAE